MLCMSVIIHYLQTGILTHFACRADDKISVICQTLIHSFESAGKMCDSWRHMLLVNDVIYGVRRCYFVFTLAYATWSKYWREFFSAKAESWRLQICFRRLLCIKIEIDQLQCVICCVFSNYDLIISHALEKQNRKERKKQGV